MQIGGPGLLRPAQSIPQAPSRGLQRKKGHLFSVKQTVWGCSSRGLGTRPPRWGILQTSQRSDVQQ